MPFESTILSFQITLALKLFVFIFLFFFGAKAFKDSLRAVRFIMSA